MKSATFTGLAVLCMAFALSSAHLLGPDDLQAERDGYDAQAELMAAEPGSQRQQVAAQAMCIEARGLNSEARWLPDGSLVCTVRQGVKTAAASSGDVK
ncbi:MAG: hypothetical protein Q7T78_17190 [Rhodoferax sp.]|nr:hypothetical protein [Rhodoferax sp.]